MFLNYRFQKDPVAIAREHVLLPGNGLYSQTSENATLHPSIKERENLNNGSQYLSMPGTGRVMYLDLTKTNNGINISYSPTKKFNWIPIFWLPWAAGKVFKTTLHDKRDRSDNPKIFLTAAVDGCSVFVEGDPQKPSVYHSNAMGANPNNIVDPKNNMIPLRTDRMDLMENRLVSVKEPKRGFGNMRVVEGRHYQDDFVQAPNTVTQGQLAARLQQKFGTKKLIGHGQVQASRLGANPYSIDPTFCYQGTVFGIKGANSNWEFWYQCRVEIAVWTLKNRDLDPTKYASWKQTSHWLPSTVEQFWPAGGGRAIARHNPLPLWPG